MPADTVAVAKAVLQHLNKWDDKPCRFALEELPQRAPALMLQSQSSSGVLRSYVSGTFIGVYSFAIYYRADMTDNETRLSAYETLERLADWLKTGDLPELGGNRQALKIELTATPSLAQIDDDIEDYQAIFSLQYKQLY
mgnify:CR=1 FL=1